METSLPTPMTARVYVNLPVVKRLKCWEYETLISYTPKHWDEMRTCENSVVKRERFGARGIPYSPTIFPIQWEAKELLRVSQPYIWLVVLEHFLFSPILGMMIQSDFHIFQRG